MRPPITPYTNYYKDTTIVRPTILDDLKRKYNHQIDSTQFITPSTSKHNGIIGGNNINGGRRWQTMNLNNNNSQKHNNKTINIKSYY